MENLTNEIVSTLHSFSEENYQKFSQNLIPNASCLGVRTPILRTLAREFVKNSLDEIEKFAHTFKPQFHEEAVFLGFVINLAKFELEKKLNLSEEFVRSISNWAICDCFAVKVKSDFKIWLNFCEQFANSKHEFEARYYYVMFLKNFINKENLPKFFDTIMANKNEAYYVKMAIAWALCECFIKERDLTYSFLTSRLNEPFILKKSIQKICESYRVSQEDKLELKGLKKQI
ncbi:DNA alkylation repair protein [Campylobacter geochelonis]|uniref:DNA alkylation repair enzyme n=1 Tax=Campylobacter geochelonis TaxID=1780362 RepID=A0A128EMR0_9BACT|nr:DNA alkylation repair protein [Campylobacter geochelonis]QKF70521.1 AlkD-like DNA glycosylase [Campylobacter geochelonis]CZE46116.1 DNA alkylation repair enzyme [Campylobacter geochelonis]CZE50437.1 DNA alkylation repair enzyme [Campylobacter geochelonis]